MSSSSRGNDRRFPSGYFLVFLAIFVIAVCGIVYELIIATISSYLLGDSVLQFSLTIGLYMSALGLGAYLSQWFRQRLFEWFLAIEVLVGLLGGSSALFLFAVYAESDLYEPAMYATTLAIGMLVGLEIPLIMRLLGPPEETASGVRRPASGMAGIPFVDPIPPLPGMELRTNVAFVLSADYVGGLLGSIVFPLLLLPRLGLIRTSALIGLGNVAVAGLILGRWGMKAPVRWALAGAALGAAGLLGMVLWWAQPLERYLEQRLYRDPIVMTLQTPYQHLTLTRSGVDTRLFINGALQFSSLDEYRYHEALVHVPLGFRRDTRRVLILGGGDGLAAREVLKYPEVRRVVLVDLDPAVTRLAQTDQALRDLNAGSLADPRLEVVNQDAYKYLEQGTPAFDAILVDLPDPENTATVKLYSREFYRMAGKHLQPDGLLVTQSTSPFFARLAFWCIHKTLASAGFQVYAYHLNVPSFGDWGFNLASFRPLRLSQFRLGPVPLRYLKEEQVPGLFRFGSDEDGAVWPELQVNTLINPVLLRYYRMGWDRMRK